LYLHPIHSDTGLNWNAYLIIRINAVNITIITQNLLICFIEFLDFIWNIKHINVNIKYIMFITLNSYNVDTNINDIYTGINPYVFHNEYKHSFMIIIHFGDDFFIFLSSFRFLLLF